MVAGDTGPQFISRANPLAAQRPVVGPFHVPSVFAEKCQQTHGRKGARHWHLSDTPAVIRAMELHGDPMIRLRSRGPTRPQFKNGSAAQASLIKFMCTGFQQPCAIALGLLNERVDTTLPDEAWPMSEQHCDFVFVAV